jgi:hypothetical protein
MIMEAHDAKPMPLTDSPCKSKRIKTKINKCLRSQQLDTCNIMEAHKNIAHVSTLGSCYTP